MIRQDHLVGRPPECDFYIHLFHRNNSWWNSSRCHELRNVPLERGGGVHDFGVYPRDIPTEWIYRINDYGFNLWEIPYEMNLFWFSKRIIVPIMIKNLISNRRDEHSRLTYYPMIRQDHLVGRPPECDFYIHLFHRNNSWWNSVWCPGTRNVPPERNWG